MLPSFPADHSLSSSLKKRKDDNALRSLSANDGLIDLSSNDYLGFARSANLHEAIEAFVREHGKSRNGSSGSRLLSGNTRFAEELETYIASYHHAEAALVFNSGYDANVGLFSCIAGKSDTIIYDELIHASVHDGIRLNQAQAFRFRHNDLLHLEERLKAGTGNLFVAVESVYSMDGDHAPLEAIAALCGKHNASLIVDEAHATGLFGADGGGRVNELGLEDKVFARVHTYGKALGVHGAAVVGSALLKEYLVNYSRAFIYTTALPFHSLASIRCAYEQLQQKGPGERNKLFALVRLFKERAGGKLQLVESDSPIQCMIVPGNDEVKKAATILQDAGFDVRPILSPTVPRGAERLRICLHSFNTEQEVAGLVDVLLKIASHLIGNQNSDNLAFSK